MCQEQVALSSVLIAMLRSAPCLWATLVIALGLNVHKDMYQHAYTGFSALAEPHLAESLLLNQKALPVVSVEKVSPDRSYCSGETNNGRPSASQAGILMWLVVLTTH